MYPAILSSLFRGYRISVKVQKLYCANSVPEGYIENVKLVYLCYGKQEIPLKWGFIGNWPYPPQLMVPEKEVSNQIKSLLVKGFGQSCLLRGHYFGPRHCWPQIMVLPCRNRHSKLFLTSYFSMMPGRNPREGGETFSE
jgi:hypothetical protein